MVVEKNKRKVKEEENGSDSDNNYQGEEDEEEDEEEEAVEEKDDDEGGNGGAGGDEEEMAEGGEVYQIGGMDSEEKEIEEGRGDLFKSSFLKDFGALGDSYIDIHVEEDSEEDPDEDTSNFQPSLTENQDLPSSENWQDVLGWLYKKLKDHFSMDDLVMSLQYIIDGGGEDDIANGGRVFKTASASRSLPKEEDKKKLHLK